jgi:hypothetical protein
MSFMAHPTTISGQCDALLAHHDRSADDDPADMIFHTRDFSKFIASRGITVLTDSQGRLYCSYTPADAATATRIWDGVGPAGISTAWDVSGTPRLGSLDGPHR